MGILSSVTSLALPPWLNLKFIGMWVAGLALLGLLYSWNERGHEVQRLADFQSGVTQAVSDATVIPDKNGVIHLLKPEEIVPAINGLQNSLVSARGVVTDISKQSIAYKKRADDADAKLTAQLALDAREFAVAQGTISELEARKPVTAEKICPTIEADTNLAWDGWK